jgi:hypothetical protein
VGTAISGREKMRDTEKDRKIRRKKERNEKKKSRRGSAVASA